MTDLTIGGETFRVEVDGDATRPALILSNSLGTDLSMWDGQLSALTKHFRVVRYDSRGHGGSVGGDASLARLGADALAILDALEIDRAHFCGLSMGGAVGLWLLTHAPERIARAVLANTAPRFGTPDGWNARITDVLANGMESNAEATMDRWFSPDFAAKAPERLAPIHAMLRNVSPQGYAACCAGLRDMDLREALRRIDHDVLIITGSDDPVVPAKDAAAFVAGVAGAKHVALQARHLSNIEAEAAFNAAVVTFLTAKTVPRARKTSLGKAPARKAVPPKTVPAKRGGAGRRSNAARNPLKKASAKRAPAKKAPAKKAAPPVRRAAKAGVVRRGTPKAAPAKPAKKAARKGAPAKAAPSRRATSTAAARAPVKKATAKAPAKKAAAKKAAKKTTKAVAKTLPAARRRTTKKSGRPTGRRKT